ncbi:hypothetical protein DFH09DRAFT_1489632 [Mycena vulgaris]|nr:hypothetical protein DFH09DRAFT_1489632 [Mycena vulgaris]
MGRWVVPMDAGASRWPSSARALRAYYWESWFRASENTGPGKQTSHYDSTSIHSASQAHVQILSEIFGHWAALEEDAPRKACLVYQLWCSAVVFTPIAWSRVNACLPDGQTTRRKSRRRMALPWENSEIHSDDGMDCSDDDDDRIKGMKMGRVAPRIDYIYEAIQKLRQMMLIPMPALEHLTLNTTFPTWVVSTPMHKAKGGRHRHLAIHTLSMHGMRDFQLGGILETIHPFLCLEILHFSSISTRAIKPSPSFQPITLPNVTTFTMGNNATIFASLTLPNLQMVFDGELSKDGQEIAVNLLSDLFERGTNLRSLTLSFAPNLQMLQHILRLLTSNSSIVVFICNSSCK